MEEMYIDPKQNKQNDLTEKQKLFCLEYLVDFNATKAAIRAGYSEHSARSIASENLTKPDVLKYIHQLSNESFRSIGLDFDRILFEIVQISFNPSTPINSKLKALELLIDIKYKTEISGPVKKQIDYISIFERLKAYKECKKS